MNYFTGAIFFVLLITSCSTPEVMSDEEAEIEVDIKPESSLPAWFSPNTISSSDENQFRGYSMAVAADSTEAVYSGIESAIANVRYEIDRFAEEVRENLVNEQPNGMHSRADFIIKLRNAVQELELFDSEFEREFEVRKDNITQVYTRIAVDRSVIIDRISELISDDPFSRALHTDRDEP